MNGKLKNIQLQMLDRYIVKVNVCNRPANGWIRAVRSSFGMSVRQLAGLIGITQQSAAKLEANELSDSITLKSLRRAAEALDCHVVYALVPNEGSLKNTIKKQAFKKATEIVKDVEHTMQLEAQGVGDIEVKIRQLAEELAENPNSKLWD